MRRALLEHVYSGELFFSALALFVIAVLVDLGSSHRFAKRGASVAALLAIALVLFSTTPVPLLVALPSLMAMIAYVARPRRALAVTAIVAAIVLATCELPFHQRLSIAKPARLFVIGDSLASGGFGEARPWPTLLAGLTVTNLALPSDTAAMALRNQVPQLPTPDADDCVLIEIGGNDMLDGIPATQFGAALDATLDASTHHGRCTILLELPLLPGRWRYGSTQRRLAAKHGAILIPKSTLARVLADERNTFDGVHLRQEGHDALAREVLFLFR